MSILTDGQSGPCPGLHRLRSGGFPLFCVGRAEEGHVEVQRDELLRRREHRHLQRHRSAHGQHEGRGIGAVPGQRDGNCDRRRRELLVHGRHPQLRRRRDLEDLPRHDRRQRHRERPEQDRRLQAFQCDSGGSQIKTTTSTLTIIDDEGPGTLDFSSSAYTVLEGAGLATVTVNRIGASNLALSVNYATQAAFTNPASPIFDYTSISPAQTLTFSPGEMSKTFQVAIGDDTDAEARERGARALNPMNLTGGAAPQLGPNGPAQLTTTTTTCRRSTSARPRTVVQEDALAGHATITVNRGGATNIPASVNYATSDGTAARVRTTPPPPAPSTSRPARPPRRSTSTSPTTAPPKRMRPCT